MEWRQLVMPLGSLDADTLEAALIASGAMAVTLTDAGDEPVLEPMPGEIRLWSDTRVTALYPAQADLSTIRACLAASLGVSRVPEIYVEQLEDRPWEREWLRDFRPLRFGRRLHVLPSGVEAGDADAVVVRLDPGLAFGTGTHATTALCLEWLDRAPPEGLQVLDFGCGSGILAIAALKLGAVSATCIDIDLQALTATRQNALRNGVGDAITIGSKLPDSSRQFDVVLANILAETLIEHAADLLRQLRAGGRFALAGILESQAPRVRREFELAGATLDSTAARDGWVRLSGTKVRD